MTSLANSLAGLSLLSGTNLAGVGPSLRVESKAVRLARAQFTAPPVVPVWSQGKPAPSAAAVMRLSSLIDRGGDPQRSADVASAFTAYKALKRLRALAEAGTKSSLDGSVLQKRFESGLAEVEKWLASAPSDKLAFSFGRASRKAESLLLPPAPAAEVRGDLVVQARDAGIPGLTGSERFALKISRPGASDTVSVDLSGIAQPPRLDAVAAAFNAAIASLPMLGLDGQPLLDSAGAVRPRYESQFAAVRHEGGGWGLELRSGGIEEVAIHDEGAAPALLVTATQEADGSTAPPVALSRLALPAGTMERAALSSLSAEDRVASALQPLQRDGSTRPPIAAPISFAATVTDADGSVYAVGTSRGSMGSMLSDGVDDLMLVKLDSRGRQLWQRSLGTSGSAEGMTVALDPAGGVVVGGSMTPIGGDRDVLLARFGTDGEERQLTMLRQLGDQQLAGMAVLSDGSAWLATRQSDGSASLARVDADGRVTQRQALGPEVGALRAIASDANGDLLVLSQSGEEAALRRFAGGDPSLTPMVERFAGLSASSLAVSADGSVALAGRRGLDAEVALVRGGQTSLVSLASAGDDRIDSLVFDGGKLFAAGRTSGDLGGPRTGTLDAFVARIDVAGGAVEQVRQWGRPALRSGAVTLGLMGSGDSAVHRLGFGEGAINPAETQSLSDLTALRPGDRFQLRVNQGNAKTIAIEADETAAAFAERVGKLIGRAAGKVSITRTNGAPQIRFEPAPGQRIDLLAGPDGQDALAKLGLAPGALIAPPPYDAKAPRVKPGGHYGLDLVRGMAVTDKALAKASLEKLDNAIATVRAGFRSLYWDDTKAALAEGGKAGSGPSPYLAGQLARYQDALTRLGG